MKASPSHSIIYNRLKLVATNSHRGNFSKQIFAEKKFSSVILIRCVLIQNLLRTSLFVSACFNIKEAERRSSF